MKINVYVTMMLVSAWALASNAAVLVHEPFDYNTGPLNNTPTSGTGQTGNWQLTPVNTGNATLSVADITWSTPEGYSLRPNNTGVGGVVGATGAFFLEEAINFDVNSVTYFSFLYRRPDSTAGGVGILSLNSGTTEKARLFQTVGGGAVTASIGDTLSGTGNAFPGTGEDLLIVGRIQTVASGNDTIQLQITSASGSISTNFVPTMSASAPTTGSADSLYFWFFTNEASTDAYFGNFRMGSTYDSVISPIPEPSTMVLLAMGAMLMVQLRRKTGFVAG